MGVDDITGAVALQRLCFPPPFPEELLWKPEHLLRHLDVFPDGQFVAVAEEAVIGSASGAILREEVWADHRDWDATVGGPFLQNHDPTGTTLYGVDISVAPDWRGRGIGRALYQARFDLVRRLGLRRFGTACRIPDYVAYAERQPMSPREYVGLVADGQVTDRTLTPLLRMGLTLVEVVDNHMEDAESGNAAAVLEWRPD